ncbi:beta-1,3-galactosyltransferase 1-like [Plakobranchus ocellatus]|uniref:Hexosyltransferase n=1 Tax=Plakobranchus ocellatus TaxID=259542 RepID=A0AAV4CN99_9GAST|nr:beta-1,3-galactosyltransferase 1-like [Plakobranchus ocellatus]
MTKTFDLTENGVNNLKMTNSSRTCSVYRSFECVANKHRRLLALVTSGITLALLIIPFYCLSDLDINLSFQPFPTKSTLHQAGVEVSGHVKLSPRPLTGVDTINNTLNQAGVEVSEEELLLRIKKLPLKLMSPSKQLLKHPYFSLRPSVVEHYTNSVLRQPDSTCGQAVHIIVLSHPRDVTTRRAIRETWGSVAKGRPWPGKALSLPVTLTFVLGTESPQKHSLSSINGTALSSADKEEKSGDETIQSQTYGGRPSSQPEENIESDSGDILQFDMFDSYANLTRKVLLALDWITSACKGVQYIVKVDQDIFVNVPLLLTFLKYYGENNTIYGHFYNWGKVQRKGMWAVSEEAYPLRGFPAYASGTSYVISESSARILTKLSSYFPYIPIEDAFITGILAAVGAIDRVKVAGFTIWEDPKPNACAFVTDEKYTGNRMNESDLRSVWRTQVDRGHGLNCQ